jgi:hypothetical protein
MRMVDKEKATFLMNLKVTDFSRVKLRKLTLNIENENIIYIYIYIKYIIGP